MQYHLQIFYVMPFYNAFLHKIINACNIRFKPTHNSDYAFKICMCI